MPQAVELGKSSLMRWEKELYWEMKLSYKNLNTWNFKTLTQIVSCLKLFHSLKGKSRLIRIFFEQKRTAHKIRKAQDLWDFLSWGEKRECRARKIMMLIRRFHFIKESHVSCKRWWEGTEMQFHRWRNMSRWDSTSTARSNFIFLMAWTNECNFSNPWLLKFDEMWHDFCEFTWWDFLRWKIHEKFQLNFSTFNVAFSFASACSFMMCAANVQKSFNFLSSKSWCKSGKVMRNLNYSLVDGKMKLAITIVCEIAMFWEVMAA